MWEYNYSIPNDELYHYGVKGMKWGVRRYQNPDGSLTSAGKQRYGSTNAKAIAKTVTKKAASGAKKVAKYGAIGAAVTATSVTAMGKAVTKQAIKQVIGRPLGSMAAMVATGYFTYQSFKDGKIAKLLKESTEEYLNDVQNSTNYLINDAKEIVSDAKTKVNNSSAVKSVKNAYKKRTSLSVRK